MWIEVFMWYWLDQVDGAKLCRIKTYKHLVREHLVKRFYLGSRRQFLFTTPVV